MRAGSPYEVDLHGPPIAAAAVSAATMAWRSSCPIAPEWAGSAKASCSVRQYRSVFGPFDLLGRAPRASNRLKVSLFRGVSSRRCRSVYGFKILDGRRAAEIKQVFSRAFVSRLRTFTCSNVREPVFHARALS